MSAPLFRTTLVALARYLPGLSGIRFLKDPVSVVVVLPTVFHCPETRRWILTGTLAAQAVNPSPTLTIPRATRCFRRLRVTLLEWVRTGPTVKLVALVAAPPGVVTLIGPVVAPVGTVAVIRVGEFTVKVVAATLLNVTEVMVKPVPLKFVPLIVTLVPTGPRVGVNEVIVGAGTAVTVKFVALVAVPPSVVTAIFPVVAPVGTVAVILTLELMMKAALTPLNVTEVAPVKFVPLMVTVVPTGPDAGENDVMVGTAVAPSAWTNPELRMWPKKHQFVHESAEVMVRSLFRSTSPLLAGGMAPAKPHEPDPRMSAPSVGTPSPLSTVCPMRPKVQSLPSIDSLPFESTFPPIVDQANLAAATPGLAGSVGFGYTVGRAVPLGQENAPFVTVIVTPSEVPSKARSLQSSLPSIVRSPADPLFSSPDAVPHVLQSSFPSMMSVEPKNWFESSRPFTTLSPFRSAPPPMMVGEKPPENGAAEAVWAPTRAIAWIAKSVPATTTRSRGRRPSLRKRLIPLSFPCLSFSRMPSTKDQDGKPERYVCCDALRELNRFPGSPRPEPPLHP